jgi:hypothetical protein
MDDFCVVSGSKGNMFTIDKVDGKFSVKPFNCTMSTIHQLPLLHLVALDDVVVTLGFDRVVAVWEVTKYGNYLNAELLGSIQTGGCVLET